MLAITQEFYGDGNLKAYDETMEWPDYGVSRTYTTVLTLADENNLSKISTSLHSRASNG